MKSILDALMQARSLDVLVVLGNAEHNPPMYYFVGGGHVSDALLVKKRGEAPVLFYDDKERGEAARSGLRTDLSVNLIWLNYKSKPTGIRHWRLLCASKRFSEDFDLTHGCIGVYGQVEFSLAFGMMMKSQRLMPNIEFVGEAGMDLIFFKAMETKDKCEVERIRKMGKITVEVVRHVREFYKSAAMFAAMKFY